MAKSDWKPETTQPTVVKMEGAAAMPVNTLAPEPVVNDEPATLPASLNVDLQQLVALVTASVSQALGAQKQDALLGDGGMEVLGRAIADGISKSQRRRLTFGEYLTQPGRSQFHPDPAKRPKVPAGRNFFQNGNWLNPDLLTDDEISLFSRLTHGGRYLNRLIEIVWQPISAEEENVTIRWRSKTNDDKNAFYQVARNLKDALQQIVVIQEQEDAEKLQLDEMRQGRLTNAKSGTFKGTDFQKAAVDGRNPWERDSVSA